MVPERRFTPSIYHNISTDVVRTIQNQLLHTTHCEVELRNWTRNGELSISITAIIHALLEVDIQSLVIATAENPLILLLQSSR